MPPQLRGLLFIAIILVLLAALSGFFAATVSSFLTPYITIGLALLVLYLAADNHDTFVKLPVPTGEDEQENKKFIKNDIMRFVWGGIAFALAAGSTVVLAHITLFAVVTTTLATLAFALMVAAAARAITLLP